MFIIGDRSCTGHFGKVIFMTILQGSYYPAIQQGKAEPGGAPHWGGIWVESADSEARGLVKSCAPLVSKREMWLQWNLNFQSTINQFFGWGSVWRSVWPGRPPFCSESGFAMMPRKKVKRNKTKQNKTQFHKFSKATWFLPGNQMPFIFLSLSVRNFPAKT